jgi:hypothetical protein
VINNKTSGLCIACQRDLSLPAGPDDHWSKNQMELRQKANAGTTSLAPVQLAAYFPGGRTVWVLLTISQAASLLASFLALYATYVQLDSLSWMRRVSSTLPAEAEILVVATGLLQGLLWAAMCVVFGRVKQLANAGEHQDADNRRIWQAINALQSGSNAIGAETLPNQPPHT